jgi:D-hexose-6-phosphate mutarotase
VTVRDTELQQEVRVVNSGEQDLSFTAALHSYFRAGNIGQVCHSLLPADCTM